MTSNALVRIASVVVVTLLPPGVGGAVPAAGAPVAIAPAPPAAEGLDDVAPAGWQALSLPKPPGAAAAEADDDGAGSPPVIVLPPPHDLLRTTVEQQYIVGADAATQVEASGSVNGIGTRLAALATEGPAGPRLFSRFLGMYQPGAWGAEAGDLSSEIWGFAEGFRWLGAEPADAAGVPGTRVRPALSLYVPVQQSGNRSTVVAGSDDLALGGFGLLGGEAATDGSWLARGELRQARFGLFAFDRQAAGSGSGLGTSGFLDLPLGLDLQGAWSRGGSGAAALNLNNLSLRVPLGRWGGLEAQSSGTQTLQARLRTNEVGFGTAAGPWLVHASYQRLRGDLLLGAGRTSAFGQRQLLAGLGWAASSRLRLDLEAVDVATDQGSGARWLQATAGLRLWSATSLSVVAQSPGSPFHDPVHLRLQQALPHGFSVIGEYGNIPVFQAADGAFGEPARLLLAVRKVWNVATPPGGGVVEGRVTAGDGAVGPGVPVELGRYRTVTGDRGDFAFRNVPAGSYALAVPNPDVPAALAAGAAQRLTVAPRSRTAVEVPLVPLCVVAGRVTLDGAVGGKAPAARLPKVVLRLDDQVTATASDGSFTFQNVQPGSHRLSIDAGHLPPGIKISWPSRIDLGLPPGTRLDSVKFHVAAVVRPVLVRELGR